GSEIRYGTRGSLCVDIKKDVWRDHESGEGGGVIALVIREGKAHDAASAAQYLEDNGFIRSDRDAKLNGSKPNGKDRDSEPLGTLPDRYPYHDLDGELVFYVERYENPKNFRPHLPSGKRGLPADRSKLVLYRLFQITEAVALGHTIYICEGEKDVHTAL